MTKPVTPRKILVPMDFSDESRRVFRHAVGLARISGAEVVLMTVIEDRFPYPELFAWEHPKEEFYKSMRDKAVSAFGELVATADLEVAEQIVVRGRPAAEIVEVAVDVGANVIVMARHGRSKLTSAIIGSVTDRVIRTAPCPVYVVPPE